jgi:glycosyltransferase involved in cell wall biosynthesis
LSYIDDLTIIIPAYNEAGRVGLTIADIRKFSNADIIVVSDGSTDNTVNEASEAGATVVELPFNLGYGAALQTGYKYALTKDYEFAVQMDADGQQRVTDPTSGFQALNRKVMEFYASDAYPVDYPDADVIIMLQRRGIRFSEIPVAMKRSVGKISMHSGIKPFYYIFKMLLSILVTLLRRRGEGRV